MQYDNFKQRFWISMSVIVGTIIASSVALYFLSAHMSATAATIGATRMNTASENEEFQDLANLKQDTALSATYQAVMDKLLASQEALITFPTQIDALGRADSVSTSFAFQGTPVLSGPNVPGTAQFSLDVSGPIANVIAFMKDFESTSPVLLSSLDDVSITGGGSNYTLTAQGTVYFK